MGSWDGTCMVSQLPITYETRIKVFLLQQVRSLFDNGGGYTSSSPLYQAMSLPLTGIYDTYGCVESVEDDIASQALIHCLPKILAESKVTERAKSYWNKNKPLNTEFDKMMQFLLFVERDGVTQNNKWLHHCMGLGIGLVMIREDIYNFCVEQGRKSFDDIETGSWRNLPEKAAKLKKKLLTMALRSAPDKNDKEAQSESLSDAFSVREELSSIFGSYSLSPIREALACAALYQNFEKVTTLPIECISDLFDSMMEVTYFECFLDETRKSWMVQSGKGSQEWGLDGYRAHITLAEKIIEVSKQEIKNFENEN